MNNRYLMTLDEARAATSESAWQVADRAETTDRHRLHEMLRGRQRITGISARDRRLVRRHRTVLEHVTALGFGREAVDELDGIASALGLIDSSDPLVDMPHAI